MTNIINLSQYKEKQAQKDYIKYYGNTPVQVSKVKCKPYLTLVQEKQEALEGSIQLDVILTALQEELEKEGITEDIHIIKPNPDIPW